MGRRLYHDCMPFAACLSINVTVFWWTVQYSTAFRHPCAFRLPIMQLLDSIRNIRESVTVRSVVSGTWVTKLLFRYCRRQSVINKLLHSAVVMLGRPDMNWTWKLCQLVVMIQVWKLVRYDKIRSKFISNQNSWITTKYNTTSKAPYILAKLCTIAQT